MSMRSLFCDFTLDFSTPQKAKQSEEVLLRILGDLARQNLFYLRDNPGTPKLYSKAAGIRWCPPDQQEGTWIERARIREFASMLKTFNMTDEKAAIVMRLISGSVEIFQDIPNLYRRKRGDCDRLVAARLAELWNAQIMASPWLIAYPNGSGGTTYHAVIKHADAEGSTEDPSAILGMGPIVTQREEIRKNFERQDNLVKAAHELMVVEGGDPEVLGAMIDAAGYVPQGGFGRA